MPTYRVSKVPSSRRRLALSTRVHLKGIEVDILYTLYATFRSLYLFSKASVKCLECVHRRVRCDGNFSSDDFDRLYAK
jgi:hypothetical protein